MSSDNSCFIFLHKNGYLIRTILATVLERDHDIHFVENKKKYHKIPYFLGYKTDFFSFQNNPKDLDPSYKMDLDL